jgi:MFS family permease
MSDNTSAAAREQQNEPTPLAGHRKRVNPASHSIIADFFPPKRRAFAMAILMLGANLGMMIGFVGGGFIAEHYSWPSPCFSFPPSPAIFISGPLWH